MSAAGTARKALNDALHRIGWDLSRYSNQREPAVIRQKHLAELGVDLVIDVGANMGQYATAVRQHGFGGTILSVEPQSVQFQQLTTQAAADPLWRTVRFAAGAEPGTATIRIPEDHTSSSLLPMNDEGQKLLGAYVREENVEVKTVDQLAAEVPHQRPFLKIDAQGVERAVLDGAGNTPLAGVEIELSLAPFYEGQTLWREDVDHIEGLGFTLVDLAPRYRNPKGDLLQMDGLFVRRS